MGTAQPQQEIFRAHSFAPPMELRNAFLLLPYYQRISPQVVQGYLVLRPDAAEIRQAIAPVVLVGRYHLRGRTPPPPWHGSRPPRRPVSGPPVAPALPVPPPPGRCRPARWCWQGRRWAWPLTRRPCARPGALPAGCWPRSTGEERDPGRDWA